MHEDIFKRGINSPKKDEEHDEKDVTDISGGVWSISWPVIMDREKAF